MIESKIYQHPTDKNMQVVSSSKALSRQLTKEGFKAVSKSVMNNKSEQIKRN